MYTPVATNCAPCFDIVCKSLSPVLSIDVTSLRSTMHLRLSPVRWVSFQILLTSLAHNPTKRPCRIHFSSSGVPVLVIFNTSNLFRLANRLARLLTRSGAGVSSVSRTEGSYFVGASHSVPGLRLGVFRMRTSVPPHSKETSSITVFINQMPRP